MSARVAGRGDPRGRIGGRGDPRSAWRSAPLGGAAPSAWSSSSWGGPALPGVGNPNDLPSGDGQRRIVGATRAVPFNKATELNSEIVKLSASVGEWAVKLVGTFAPDDTAQSVAAKFKDPAAGEFFLQFRQFKADWDAFYTWRRDNPPPWYSPIPSDGMTDAYGDLPAYDALFARYQTLLAKFKAMGASTTATEPSQDSLFEDAVEDASKGLGKGLGDALSNLGELGVYVVAGAVVVGGLYLAGPAIWKAVRR